MWCGSERAAHKTSPTPAQLPPDHHQEAPRLPPPTSGPYTCRSRPARWVQLCSQNVRHAPSAPPTCPVADNAARNSTTAAFSNFTTAAPGGTYWDQFEEISKYNVSLNYFERLWLAWYTYMNNDVLATGIMSFVMHEAVYFGRSLPWIIIDAIPYFNKYKIQAVSSCATGLARTDLLTRH